MLFCVERRKAWRMLQSKAGIDNKEYKAQRSILADVDTCRVSKEELFARGEQLLKERLYPTPSAKPVGRAASASATLKTTLPPGAEGVQPEAS